MGVASNRRIDFVETLGQGGFGAVYLADVYGDNDFVQRLAIKILSEEMTALDDIAARQRDEARLLAQLNHHHIVKVIDLTTINGRPAVLMEYVEGADCAQLGQQGPLSVRAALEVVAAASSALAAAWEAPSPRTGRPLRVVHRDIKPANLLVSRHGGVKVLDFGVARGEFEREGKTESVQFGTARFMAPETWLHGEVSHKSDIFALGITLVELMARDKPGRAPLLPERFATWAQDLVEAGLPTRAQDRWRDGLSGLMASMLAFEPDARPDAATVHEALLGLLEGAEGLSLSRLARDRVPPLIEARRRQYAGVPMMSSIQVQAEISAPSLLVDPSDAAAATPLPAPASRGRGWMWAAALTTGFALLGAGTLVLVGVVAWKSGGATPEAALEVGAADASLSQPDVVAVDAPPQVPVDAPDAAPASALDASIDGSAAAFQPSNVVTGRMA